MKKEFLLSAHHDCLVVSTELLKEFTLFSDDHKSCLTSKIRRTFNATTTNATCMSTDIVRDPVSGPVKSTDVTHALFFLSVTQLVPGVPYKRAETSPKCSAI